ncbi:MAG: efflux RND transporter periplasmic adaptor subunit [Alphaproteobacteria bacterium]|nr:MAG: efflux RND transporter periplasmic adaptor subunit [Alphaproteobacteria bacterium]
MGGVASSWFVGMNKFIKKIVALLVVLGSIGYGWYAFHNHEGVAPVVSPKESAPIAVQMVTLRQEEVAQPLILSADAVAQETVAITSQVNEVITAIHFEEGSQVRRGDLLVELEQREERTTLASQTTLLEEAQRNVDRVKHLLAQSFVSQAAVDHAVSALATAQQQQAMAQQQLRIRSIHAPFDGVIGVRHVSVGSLAQEGQTIATLLDLSRIRVNMHIPERYALLLVMGDHFDATTELYPKRRFEGTISVIEQNIDPATRTLRVHGTIRNADHALKAGMLLRVELAARPTPMILVPEEALIPIGNEFYVYGVDAENVVLRRKVQIGARIENRVELRDGVQAGERIITEGHMKLRDGVRVVGKIEL